MCVLPASHEYTAFLSPPPRPRFALLPRPPAGAVQVISPERPAWRSSSDYTLRRHPHAPDRGDMCDHPGRERPAPSTKTILALPRAPALASGCYRGDGPGGAQAWGGDPSSPLTTPARDQPTRTTRQKSRRRTPPPTQYLYHRPFSSYTPCGMRVLRAAEWFWKKLTL